MKEEPLSATAWRFTRVPAANVAEHALPQSMPAGADLTVPDPCVVTRKVKLWPPGGGGAAVNAAVTLASALMVMLQGPCPVHAPPQPENVEPAAAAWLSTTVVPAANAAVHVVPQSIPAGVDVTAPGPDVEIVNVNVDGGGLPTTAAPVFAPPQDRTAEQAARIQRWARPRMRRLPFSFNVRMAAEARSAAGHSFERALPSPLEEPGAWACAAPLP